MAFETPYLSRRIVQAKNYIDTHYASPIDLSSISESAHFSRYHFLRLFKKTYNKTPHQYLTTKRLDKAKDLLRNSPLSVLEICFAVGFESCASFNSLFKKKVGKTPGEFRKTFHRRQTLAENQPLVFIPGCFASMYKLEKNSTTAQP